MKRLLATLISYGYPVEPGMTVGRARYDVSGSRVLVKPGMTYVVTLTCQSHLRHNEVIHDLAISTSSPTPIGDLVNLTHTQRDEEENHLLKQSNISGKIWMKRLLATLISYGYPVEPGMTVGQAGYDGW